MAIVSSVKTESFEMKYTCFGEGERVFVILPGLSLKPVTDSAEAIEAGFEIFKKDFRVYLFDRISNPSEEYSIKQMAQDTAVAMGHLGIKKASIFGASQGGMMAQIIAIEHPELVERLVLGSTLARLNDTTKSVLAKWISLAEAKDVKGLATSFTNKVYCKETVEAFGEAIIAGSLDTTEEQLKNFVVFAKAINGFSCYKRLGRINCPVLVLGAKNDEVVTAQGSIDIAMATGGKLYIYDNYGHGVYDEASDYRGRILDFVK